ncbi:MAG: hypothetical protein WD468_03040 [Pirellulales bacterium]
MKRLSRPWKVALVTVAGVVGAAAIVVAAVNANADAEWERRLAELRHSGQPTSLLELARKPPPPEQNAVTYLRRAQDHLDSIDKETSAAYENESDDDQEAIDRGRPTPRFIEAIRSALAAYPKTVPLLEQAAGCPDYDAQLDYTADTDAFMDELHQQILLTRRSLRILNYAATLQIADGDYDGAIGTGLTMLALCRHVDRDPTIMGCLVALACREVATSTIDLALRSGEIFDAARDALDAELARHDVVDAYRKSLITDQAFGLQVLQEVAAGKHRDQLKGNDAYWYRAAGFKNDRHAYLDYMAGSIAAAALPYSERKNRPAIAKALAEVGLLGEFVAPATEAANAAVNRTQVYLCCLRILSAIQRFDKAHPGSEPTFALLNLPEETTTDPFNGQPLHLEKKPGGWLIYSVGRNLKGDGGKVVGAIHDCGFGPLPRIRRDD